MKTCLLVAALLLLSVCWSSAALVGGRKALKPDDFKAEHVVKAVKYATAEIHKQKLKNGEVNECIRLTPKLLRGSTQVVAGTKYNLELKMTPVNVAMGKCATKQNKVVQQLKPEVCEVEIWSHPWKSTQLELLRSVCLQLED